VATSSPLARQYVELVGSKLRKYVPHSPLVHRVQKVKRATAVCSRHGSLLVHLRVCFVRRSESKDGKRGGLSRDASCRSCGRLRRGARATRVLRSV